MMRPSGGVNTPRRLAIIPARAGSQRIPNKNLRAFRGQPLISYSIEAALASGLFERVVVSTDSERIAAVSRQYGAEVPFERPTSLSDGLTPIAPVLLHALEQLGGARRWDELCCIYATAPLLRVEDIRRGTEAMQAADAAMSVATFPYPIQRALQVSPKGRLAFREPAHELTRSQDLPECVHDAGQFTILEATMFAREKRLVPENTVPVVVPRERVQDIDTPDDWRVAELLAELLDPQTHG